MRVFLLALALSTVMATPAAADPIFTPIFTTLLTSAFGAGAATAIAFGTTTWVALLSGIATIALGIGLMLLLTPKPPKAEDGHQVVQQAIPAHIYGYGRARVAGALAFKEVSGGDLWYVAALTGHRIIGFVGYYLHDDRVTLSSGTQGNVITTSEASDGRYGANVSIDTRRGNAPETPYYELIAAFPGVWTANHRGDYCASLCMRCGGVGSKDFSKVYPYGAPQPSAILDLYAVFDPRVAGQAWDRPETWTDAGYDNPVLALVHFECFSDYGPKRDFQVAFAPVLDAIIDRANWCDELVPLKSGGTEKRYRLGGWTNAEQNDPRATRLLILQACDGWFVERGDGSCWVEIGLYQEPTVTLTDDDICGWSWQSNMANTERSEYLVAKWTSPDNDYVTVDTDATKLDNGALSVDQDRTANLELTWVQSNGQASRLQKREASRYAEKSRGVLELRLSGLNALYNRWIYVNSSIPRLRGAVIENRNPKLSLMDGKCTLEFVSSGPHVDDYDPATDESQPPTVVSRPVQAGLPIPANVSGVAEELTSSNGVSIVIATTFDVPTSNGSERTDLSYILALRVSGTTSWSYASFATYTPSAHRISLMSGLVASDQVYDVQVFSVSTSGVQSVGSSIIEVSTAVASTAPSHPSNVVATGYAGQATITWVAPNAPNISACRVWRDVSGGSFATAVAVSPPIYCSANQALSFVDASVPAGGYLYWVTALNSAGTPSSPSTPPASATVT